VCSNEEVQAMGMPIFGLALGHVDGAQREIIVAIASSVGGGITCPSLSAISSSSHGSRRLFGKDQRRPA